MLITATISGLKKDTKYYVKCSATGKGGTATTGTTIKEIIRKKHPVPFCWAAFVMLD